MRLIDLWTFPVLMLVAGCAAPQVPPSDFTAKSTRLADRFQKELQGQLQAAMKASGPVGAIGVCHQAAPMIAATLSKETGAEVRRVALRPRNPDAAVSGDMAHKLNTLAKAPLDYSGRPRVLEWVHGKGKARRAYYLRAIPMQAVPCAACHGTEIAPDVQARLAELYPQDQATGFRPGELRGALAISWPVAR